MPQRQCFTAAEYADLVVTTQLIDEVNDPKNNTLELYRAKTTNSVIPRHQIKQFLQAQSGSSGLKVDRTAKDQLKLLLAEAAEDIYSEAERIIKMLNQQRNLIMPLMSE